MDITILLNITYILGSIQFITTASEYYIQHYSILHVKLYNITQYYMLNIAYWVVFNTIYLNIQWGFQYYSILHVILHVILSNTHLNILLHIGEYWFQYNIILPEQLACGDAMDIP